MGDRYTYYFVIISRFVCHGYLKTIKIGINSSIWWLFVHVH